MTTLFADDQAVTADSEGTLQRAAHELHLIAKEYNLIISTQETKVMAFKGLEPVI